MNLTQGSIGNLGTCRFDVKGAIQAEDLQGFEYRSETQGRTRAYER